MDEMNAFERQLAARLEHKAGPFRPIDAMAIAHSAIEAAQGDRRVIVAQDLRDTAPGTGRSTVFSALKFVAAAAIVALFGGFLLAGILSTPQETEVLPADETGSPSPTATSAPSFPTGTFVVDGDDTTLILRPDGTCDRAGVPCTFGVTGMLFSEMTFDDPSGPQKPATYDWAFDGEQLTFELWGEDQRTDREAVYADHVFRPLGETVPLPVRETEFPVGVFDPVGGGTSLSLRENGTVSGGGIVGKYAVNGDLFTEMTHNSHIAEKVPATYYWRWDGDQLSFRLWGEDRNAARKALYAGHVYARQQSSLGETRRLMLSDPRLDYWVTVELREQDEGYTATATVDDQPSGTGAGDTAQEAVEAALDALDVPYASEMAEDVPG